VIDATALITALIEARVPPALVAQVAQLAADAGALRERRDRDAARSRELYGRKRKTSRETRETREEVVRTPAQQAEVELYRVGKALLGKNAGGLISSLLRHANYDLGAARAVIDQAATKQDPREWVSASMRSKANGKSALKAACDDLVARAEFAERTLDLEPAHERDASDDGGGGTDWPVR
jgi:hypothetical protein